jgi:alkylhydroperoxidase family enzyme
VLATPGHTPSEVRRAIEARAGRLAGRRDGVDERRDAVPAPLARYVDAVALHAHQVTDGDLAALLRGGSSDDAVFEVTVAAALGAALGRLERGLAALRGEEPD